MNRSGGKIGRRSWKMSEETKLKMSLAHKGKQYKPMSEKGRKNISRGMKGIIPWNKGKKLLPQLSGKNNHNWKGGISKDAHSSKEPRYRQWHSDVFERDNWTCQTCQKRGCYLEAHHIKSWAKFPELRYDLNNDVTLCRECHKLTHNYRKKEIR